MGSYRRRPKKLSVAFWTMYVYFLSVTVGGAFPTVFLSVLRKCTVLRKRTVRKRTILPTDYDV